MIRGEKLLLLTATPPGTANVGEIILRDLALHYGPERITCVAVVPPGYAFTPDPSLPQLEVRTLASEHARARRGINHALGGVRSFVNYATNFRPEVARLVEAAVETARSAGATRIFAVLNSPLLMSMAHRVAAATSLPLTTLVWDPPAYLLRLWRFDRMSRGLLMRDFRASLRRSLHVAVVSDAMRSEYAAHTAASIRVLRHGVPADASRVDDPSPTGSTGLPTDEWVIGFAGSMYSDDSWKALLRALDHSAWRIAGRPVRIKVLSSELAIKSASAARVEFLGFRAAAEVQAILSQCHLTYMPQPFRTQLRELCRFAFPTKLTTYLALGRPVLVHAPADSALSHFVRDNPIGACVTTLEPQPIIEALTGLLGDADAYAEACRRVRAVARDHFSEGSFHRAIDDVLGNDASHESAGADSLSSGVPAPSP